MHDVEAIERATLAATPPLRIEELNGWLVGLDDGTVGRAHSAVPLAHQAAPPGLRSAIEQVFRTHGRTPVWRVPEAAAFEGLRIDLRAQEYRRMKRTLVQVGSVAAMQALGSADGVALTDMPGADFDRVFLGEGFDPVDGASRLAILRRGRTSVFAGIHADGELVAVGSACFAHGWCGVHGMRTLAPWRGRGLAARILSALAAEAARRGIARSFLQVEAGNAPAQALYARAGFTTAWGYEYWKP